MKEKTEEFNFFTTDEVSVDLTMKGFPTMTFFLREILSSEADELRKKHLALTKDEREKQKHIHDAKMLTLLCTKAPQNPLPGIPALESDFKTVLFDFLTNWNSDVEEAKKKALVENVMVLYNQITQPQEFFRVIQNRG